MLHMQRGPYRTNHFERLQRFRRKVWRAQQRNNLRRDMMMCVALSRSTVSTNVRGSKLLSKTYFAPRYIAGISVTKAPLKTMEPEWSTTLSGVMRKVEAKSVQ